jgi:hypothetical protein
MGSPAGVHLSYWRGIREEENSVKIAKIGSLSLTHD